jgi:hypothetical protein
MSSNLFKVCPWICARWKSVATSDMRFSTKRHACIVGQSGLGKSQVWFGLNTSIEFFPRAPSLGQDRGLPSDFFKKQWARIRIVGGIRDKRDASQDGHCSPRLWENQRRRNDSRTREPSRDGSEADSPATICCSNRSAEFLGVPLRPVTRKPDRSS